MNSAIFRTSSICLLILSLACVKTPADLDREYAQSLRPKSLTPAPAPTAKGAESIAPSVALRPLRVRVYADEEFRTQNLHWREKTEALFSAANRVIEPQLGVRFVAADLVAWDRAATHTT